MTHYPVLRHVKLSYFLKVYFAWLPARPDRGDKQEVGERGGGSGIDGKAGFEPGLPWPPGPFIVQALASVSQWHQKYHTFNL